MEAISIVILFPKIRKGASGHTSPKLAICFLSFKSFSYPPKVKKKCQETLTQNWPSVFSHLNRSPFPKNSKRIVRKHFLKIGHLFPGNCDGPIGLRECINRLISTLPFQCVCSKRNVYTLES